MSNRLVSAIACFQSRFSRPIVAWLFLSIVAIEAVIIVPSYFRRKHELLLHLEDVSSGIVQTVNQLKQAGVSDSVLMETLDRVSQNSDIVIGIKIYTPGGEAIIKSGELPQLSYTDLDRADTDRIRKLTGNRYDIAWSPPNPQSCRFIIRHDASKVGTQLIAYIGRIGALVLLISMVVTLVAIAVLGKHAIAPILRLRDDLIAAADILSQGHPATDFYSMKVKRDDELGEVMQAFDRLFHRVQTEMRDRTNAETQLKQKAAQLEQTLEELKRTQSQLIQSEKMSSLGQLMAGMAHEINNPVSFIGGNLVHVRQYLDDLFSAIAIYRESNPPLSDEAREDIEQLDLDFVAQDMPKLIDSMNQGVNRIHQVVLALQNFSRHDEADLKRADIHEGIESTLFVLQHRLAQHNIHLVKQYGNLPKIECYPKQLNQVFANLIANAIDALQQKLPPSPTISIRTAQLENDWIEIRIADNGAGMTETVRQRAFDPFFTTKAVGSGTGLGLSISYQIIVAQHRGRLTCNSAPDSGTEIAIAIPPNSAQ